MLFELPHIPSSWKGSRCSWYHWKYHQHCSWTGCTPPFLLPLGLRFGSGFGSLGLAVLLSHLQLRSDKQIVLLSLTLYMRGGKENNLHLSEATFSFLKCFCESCENFFTTSLLQTFFSIVWTRKRESQALQMYKKVLSAGNGNQRHPKKSMKQCHTGRLYVGFEENVAGLNDVFAQTLSSPAIKLRHSVRPPINVLLFHRSLSRHLCFRKTPYFGTELSSEVCKHCQGDDCMSVSELFDVIYRVLVDDSSRSSRLPTLTLVYR